MAQMKNEFRSILLSISPVKSSRLSSNISISYTDSTDQSTSFIDSDCSSCYSVEAINTIISQVNLVPDATIHRLCVLAKRMISTGNSRVCVDVYASVRKASLEYRIEDLPGVDRLHPKYITRLDWQFQQAKIRRWILAAKAIIRGLFTSERALTNRIFNDLGANVVADDCFMKTVKDPAIKLFNFVEVISSGRRSPEKLFQILELHQVLSDLLPDIETIFASKSGEFIRKMAAETLSMLSETARGILAEFEKTVFGEISRVPIPEGCVHPMTRYVMSYMHDMVEHEQTLTQLIVSKPSCSDYIHSSELDRFDFSEFEGGDVSSLVLHLVWIVVVLKYNLEGKSKQCRDKSSARLFMTINVDYIVREIKESSELRKMIGDDYQNKFISLAEANYRKSTWNKILDYCFRKVTEVFGLCMRASMRTAKFRGVRSYPYRGSYFRLDDLENDTEQEISLIPSNSSIANNLVGS